MTRADLMHCVNIPDAREELNRSVEKGEYNLDILLGVWKGWGQVQMT